MGFNRVEEYRGYEIQQQSPSPGYTSRNVAGDVEVEYGYTVRTLRPEYLKPYQEHDGRFLPLDPWFETLEEAREAVDVFLEHGADGFRREWLRRHPDQDAGPLASLTPELFRAKLSGWFIALEAEGLVAFSAPVGEEEFARVADSLWQVLAAP